MKGSSSLPSWVMVGLSILGWGLLFGGGVCYACYVHAVLFYLGGYYG